VEVKYRVISADYNTVPTLDAEARRHTSVALWVGTLLGRRGGAWGR
jgi:hypothetical protein